MKHFVIPSDISIKKIDDVLLRAQENSADAVIISPKKADLKSDKKLVRRTALIFAKASYYGFDVEIGGWDLSRLVPRNRFLFHKELFRMVQGKRIKQTHFCSTNPDTINMIQKEARKLFSRFPEIKTFHLWPDRNKSDVWCNCPSCRAFSFAEQNLIAVNAAADVLALINPEAKLSYIEVETNNDEEPSIKPRENMFAIDLDSITA
jgi:hypothetical protein